MRLRTRDWEMMGLYSKDIKKITNRTTKMRNSASEIITYGHQGKVISSLLDGPKPRGNLSFSKRGLKTGGNQCLLRKKRNPKIQKEEPIVLKIKKREDREIMKEG